MWLFSHTSRSKVSIVLGTNTPLLNSLAWLRIVFAEGPRQVINALTLYSVMEANLAPVGEHAPKEGGSPAAQFFINIRILANHNKEQAAILFGMLFTLVIWAIAALSLILAALCYILFLWHYIPTADDGLSGYCRRKVDSRLHKIVGVKVKRALAIDFSSRSGSDSKTIKGGEIPARVIRQPTLPILDVNADDKQNALPISRQTTQMTSPLYAPSGDVTKGGRAKHGLRAELIIPYMPPFQNRPVPSSRTTTNTSANSSTSYASNAPLLQGAQEMSYGPSPDLHSSAPPSPSSIHGTRPPPSIGRNLTHTSNGTQRSHGTAYRPHISQARNIPGSMPIGHPGHQEPHQPEFNFSTPQFRSVADEDRFRPTFEVSSLDRSGGHGPKIQKHHQDRAQVYEMQHQRPTDEVERYRTNGAYIAFNPSIQMQPEPSSAEFVPRKSAMGPTRNFTLPFNRPHPGSFTAQRPAVPQRSGTAPIPFTTPDHPPLRNTNFQPRNEAPPPMTLPRRTVTAGPGAAVRNEGRPAPQRLY